MSGSFAARNWRQSKIGLERRMGQVQHKRNKLLTDLILKPLSIDWSVAGAKIPAVTFITQAGLTTRELAHVLDSLVRVQDGSDGTILSTARPQMSSSKHIHPPGDRLPCP